MKTFSKDRKDFCWHTILAESAISPGFTFHWILEDQGSYAQLTQIPIIDDLFILPMELMFLNSSQTGQWS